MLTLEQVEALRRRPADRGNRVAAAIDAAGVTQVVVAAATGLPQPYISDVVRGRYQTITVANARKFAEFFGCSIEDLFPARQEVA